MEQIIKHLQTFTNIYKHLQNKKPIKPNYIITNYEYVYNTRTSMYRR